MSGDQSWRELTRCSYDVIFFTMQQRIVSVKSSASPKQKRSSHYLSSDSGVPSALQCVVWACMSKIQKARAHST